MKVVALVSGGKDSIFNILECARRGHATIAIANLVPQDRKQDDIDSWMFQTVGHNVVGAIAECLRVPLFQEPIRGTGKCTGLAYEKTEEDEVEDLFNLLAKVKAALPEIEAVGSGAILSNYQRIRVENVCSRLGLVSLAYLWQRDQTELLGAMVDSQMNAILVKCAGMGLCHKHLGKSIAQLYPYLVDLGNKFGCNVCGEGGEFESFTLDCPMFYKSIIIEESQIVGDVSDKADLAPVALFRTNAFRLQDKPNCIASIWHLLEQIKSASATPLPLPSAPSPASDIPAFDSLPLPMEAAQMLSMWGEGENEEVECVAESDVRRAEEEIRQEDRQQLEFVVVEPPKAAATLREEVTELMENLKVALARRELRVQDVFFVHFLLRDMSDFQEANGLYKETFPLVEPPSRACVQLPLQRNVRVALDCLAFRGPRKVLHVQSISCWAPCCIGPYAQASNINGLVFLAGQIGLVPSTMTLPCPLKQIEQTLSNCRRVLQVECSSFSRVVLCIVYLSTPLLAETGLAGEVRRQCAEALADGPGVEILYVAVPRLPRSAFVEVQLIAHRKELEDRMEGLKAIEHTHTVTHTTAHTATDTHPSSNTTQHTSNEHPSTPAVLIEERHTSQPNVLLSSLLYCSVPTLSSILPRSLLSAAVDRLVHALASAVKGSEFGWAQVRSLRVFHRESVSGALLKQEWRKACSTQSLPLPSVSFLPVDHLPSPSAVSGETAVSAPTSLRLFVCHALLFEPCADGE